MKTVLFRTLPLLAAVAVGFGLNNTFQAQTAPVKVGFVNTDAVFKAHPLNGNIETLKTGAQKELEPMVKQIQDIQAKGDKATAKEKQDLDTLLKTANAARTKWNDQIVKATGPMNDSVNKVLTDIAKQQGFSILLDRAVASQSGLVIYADESSTDITDTVVKAVTKK